MKKIILIVAVLLAAAACGTCGSRSDSILGYWTFKGGIVQIKVSGSGFAGVIVATPQSGPCAEPDGYVLLKLSGSGNHYTGSEEWWSEPTCQRLYSNTAVIDVSGATAHMCSKDPFPDPGPDDCVDMQRLSRLPSPSQ